MFGPLGRRGHPTIEELSEHLDGRLTGPHGERVAQHLSGCDPCRRAFDDLRAAVFAVRAAPQPPLRRSYVFAAPPAPAGQNGRAVAARARSSSGGLGPSWALPAMAVAVFVLFLGAVTADFGGLARQASPAPTAGSSLSLGPTDGGEAAAEKRLDDKLAAQPEANSPADKGFGATVTADEALTMTPAPYAAGTPTAPPMARAAAEGQEAPPAAATAAPAPTPTAAASGDFAPAMSDLSPMATPAPTWTLAADPTAAPTPTPTPSPTPTPEARTAAAPPPSVFGSTSVRQDETSRMTEPVPTITPAWLRALEIVLGAMAAVLAAAAVYTARRA